MSTEAPKFFPIKGKKAPIQNTNMWETTKVCPTEHLSGSLTCNCVSHVCGGIRSRVCQEHTFVEIVGKAGVIAGAAAAAWVRHRRPDSGDLLRLAQLLDEETLVTALLLDKDATDAGNKTWSKQGLKMLS